MSGTGVVSGALAADMPYLRIGSGAPLMVLPGLSPHHRPPRGMERWAQVQQCRWLARRREVWWVNRRHGLQPGATMADLARDYAEALRPRFGHPVDVLGVSTGGSVALQLAVDHPDVVRRLVIVSAAYRLGALGRQAQRRAADQLRAGRPRRAAAAMMTILGAGPGVRRMMRPLGWLLGPAVAGTGDPDLLITIDAEDAFDLRPRLAEITAPTLIIGGDRDACYGRELFERTAAGIPHARLILYPGKGHMGIHSRRLAADVLAFLSMRSTGSRPRRVRLGSAMRPRRGRTFDPAR